MFGIIIKDVLIAVSSCFWPVCCCVWTQLHLTDASARQSHLKAKSTTCRCHVPSHKPLQCFHQWFLTSLLLSCSHSIVNQGENNIGVLCHSMHPHSCRALCTQIQSCIRPLPQPSATVSGLLGKVLHTRLGMPVLCHCRCYLLCLFIKSSWHYIFLNLQFTS